MKIKKNQRLINWPQKKENQGTWANSKINITYTKKKKDLVKELSTVKKLNSKREPNQGAPTPWMLAHNVKP
jgi:hypothetical protein